MGLVGATHNDELPGHAPSEYGGDAKHDDARTTNQTANLDHPWHAARSDSRGTNCE